MWNERLRRALLGLMLWSPIVGCGDDDPSSTRDPDAGSEDGGTDAGTALDFRAFDLALEAAIAQQNAGRPPDQQLRGASAVVVHKTRGIVHQQGYGEYTADRLYVVASASKILSVGILMRLADQGMLDIDAPISTYLGSWGSSAIGGLTLAQLLSNSSGLASIEEVGYAALDATSPYRSQICQFADTSTLRMCGEAIYTTSPLRPPDTTFRYGGSQWHLAGAIAEVVSGKSWSQLVRETYVEPCDAPSLGYTNVFLRTPTGVYPSFFMGDPANLPPTENPSIEGGGYASAPDYAKLLLMHLRGGVCGDTRVLSEQAVARMQQNRIQMAYNATTPNARLPGYGLGWWLEAGGRWIADPGMYGTWPYLDLDRGYGLVIAIERDTATGTAIVDAVRPTLEALFPR